MCQSAEDLDIYNLSEEALNDLKLFRFSSFESLHSTDITNLEKFPADLLWKSGDFSVHFSHADNCGHRFWFRRPGHLFQCLA
ncbi:hypothetical protein GALMADRAFT_880282 [Galerina marginata CBS 339.88]|uniref:Uncharacterized protein n=1 Tax=Galerina marginata (strain CBS 339.88) TaxID=685588 RepID=A0A067SI80_GALM3|nr:hypothetical protein GALMADRAFT_880282 [Galerina marginata CBS 339.88]